MVSRVARGNFTPRPSQIRTGQSPVIRLLSSSRHFQRPCLTSWLLPSLVDQVVRPDDPTPSLHLHYRDFNTTTNWSVPVPCIGTLTLMGSSHLSFSLNIRTTASHVPHKSPVQVHATFMPDAAQAVSRSPLNFSWSSVRPLVLTSPFCFRHLIDGSLALISLSFT